MTFVGIEEHGQELAEVLATLLVRHGYAQVLPDSGTALLELAKKAKAEPADAWVLIQEGGSSFERYLHAHDSEEAAEADRIDCARDGGYRTSPVLRVSGALADTPGFYEAVEASLSLLSDLDLVDVPDEDDDEDESTT